MATTTDSSIAQTSPTKSKADPGGNINPAAPAGAGDSLGEESIRDGRPATDDSTVEAIDEETPATPRLPER